MKNEISTEDFGKIIRQVHDLLLRHIPEQIQYMVIRINDNLEVYHTLYPSQYNAQSDTSTDFILHEDYSLPFQPEYCRNILEEIHKWIGEIVTRLKIFINDPRTN
jgi:hypothetical protein